MIWRPKSTSCSNQPLCFWIWSSVSHTFLLSIDDCICCDRFRIFHNGCRTMNNLRWRTASVRNGRLVPNWFSFSPLIYNSFSQSIHLWLSITDVWMWGTKRRIRLIFAFFNYIWRSADFRTLFVTNRQLKWTVQPSSELLTKQK